MPHKANQRPRGCGRVRSLRTKVRSTKQRFSPKPEDIWQEESRIQLNNLCICISDLLQPVGTYWRQWDPPPLTHTNAQMQQLNPQSRCCFRDWQDTRQLISHLGCCRTENQSCCRLGKHQESCTRAHTAIKTMSSTAVRKHLGKSSFRHSQFEAWNVVRTYV